MDQVKKEDAGARPSTLQLSSCDNLEVGMLEPQGIAREVDAATATGFPVDEQLSIIGTAVNGDLGHFAAGDYVPFGDGSGVPIEETKDMGMDEFLNAFLRVSLAFCLEQEMIVSAVLPLLLANVQYNYIDFHGSVLNKEMFSMWLCCHGVHDTINSASDNMQCSVVGSVSSYITAHNKVHVLFSVR